MDMEKLTENDLSSTIQRAQAELDRRDRLRRNLNGIGVNIYDAAANGGTRAEILDVVTKNLDAYGVR